MDANSILVENYFGLLNRLSKENKIKLIAKLSNSLIEESTVSLDVVDKYFGAFESDQNAEELVNMIRDSRVFNRSIEDF